MLAMSALVAMKCFQLEKGQVYRPGAWPEGAHPRRPAAGSENFGGAFISLFLADIKARPVHWEITSPRQTISERGKTMSGAFTKSMARNIFYGGTVFFFLLFLALSFDTHSQLPKRDMRQNITPQIAEGKKLWEVNNCIGCHTLMGEGAYFAPELANVVVRYGDEGTKAFIQSRPKEGIPGRRSMPQFNFTDEQLDAIVAFLKHVNSINDANWPPNDQG
jgi:nitric oxide reductase subunit C